MVAEQLNLVALQLDVRLDAWEIENTREVEGIVNIQVNPEQRLVLHGVEGTVEALVVLVLQRAGSLGPQGLYAVDDVVFVCVNLLAVLPLGLLAESQWYRHELAVFVEQFLNLEFLQKLFAVIIDVEDDVTASLCLFCLVNLIGRTAVATPLDGYCILTIAAGDDFHLLAHHERGIETKSEMSDDVVGVVLVFFQEIVDS